MISNKNGFRIVYFGSPDFAVPPLLKLIEAGYNIPLVVTQPDRPKGRKRQLTPTAVRQAAEEYGIPVLAVENANQPKVVEKIAAAKPDLMVVAAFGQIMRDDLIQTAPLGAINIHASLLPEYRGASPIQQALIDGRDETGITIMYIAPRLDAGDMLAQKKCKILPGDNTGTLRERLSMIGAEMLPDVIEEMRADTLTPTPQDENAASYTGKITTEQEHLDWRQPAVNLHNLLRGLTPDTSAYTCYKEQTSTEPQRLKIWQTALTDIQSNAAPGTLLEADKDGLLVACGNGVLKLCVVQPVGKGQMKATDWWRGRRDLQESGLCFF